MIRSPLPPRIRSANRVFVGFWRWAIQVASPHRVKRLFVGGLLFGLLFTGLLGCGPAPKPTITFCNVPGEPVSCTDDQTEFSVGQQLYVQLASSKPLEAQQVVGKILRVTEKDTVSLGSRTITPEPDQRYFIQTLPFHEFGPEAVGTFLISFVDENGQLIAEKNLTINQAPSP